MKASHEILIFNEPGILLSCLAFGVVVAGHSQTPPAITLEPESQNVLVGMRATFSVTATGTAPLHYQWRQDGTNLLSAMSRTLALANLLEYASGLDPRSADAGAHPTVSVQIAEARQYLALTFRRLLLAHEVSYGVEASSDLAVWNEVGDAIGEPVLNRDGTLSVTIRDNVALDAASKRFLRLKVSRR